MDKSSYSIDPLTKVHDRRSFIEATKVGTGKGASTASAEKGSEHPLGEAIVRKAQGEFLAMENFLASVGLFAVTLLGFFTDPEVLLRRPECARGSRG